MLSLSNSGPLSYQMKVTAEHFMGTMAPPCQLQTANGPLYHCIGNLAMTLLICTLAPPSSTSALELYYPNCFYFCHNNLVYKVGREQRTLAQRSAVQVIYISELS